MNLQNNTESKDALLGDDIDISYDHIKINRVTYLANYFELTFKYVVGFFSIWHAFQKSI